MLSMCDIQDKGKGPYDTEISKLLSDCQNIWFRKVKNQIMNRQS